MCTVQPNWSWICLRTLETNGTYQDPRDAFLKVFLIHKIKTTKRLPLEGAGRIPWGLLKQNHQKASKHQKASWDPLPRQPPPPKKKRKQRAAQLRTSLARMLILEVPKPSLGARAFQHSGYTPPFPGARKKETCGSWWYLKNQKMEKTLWSN